MHKIFSNLKGFLNFEVDGSGYEFFSNTISADTYGDGDGSGDGNGNMHHLGYGDGECYGYGPGNGEVNLKIFYVEEANA
jgi:hypothetical protein